MPSHRFDDAWFARERHRLLSRRGFAEPPAFAARTVLHDARLAGLTRESTARAIDYLAPRHAAAARAHLQLYRACLESLALVPADDLVNAAVQIEWLWYTTPFKRFYRDHLAHVMKVALIGVWLLEDPASPLADGGTPLADRIAAELARGALGSPALRAAARRCGLTEAELSDASLWRRAVVEATRIAGLLHDMAYPDVMAGKVARAADPVRPLVSFDRIEADTARTAVQSMAHRLAMSPFHEGKLPGTDGLDGAGLEAATAAYALSHSPRAAHAILRIREEADRLWRLSAVDAFVLEWAALAAGLHDLDKLFELARSDRPASGTLERQLQIWAQKGGAEHLRPTFCTDPVSYLVALADQIQDFGRVHYQPSHGTRPIDGVSLEARYPCTGVELAIEGTWGAFDATITFDLSEAGPFGAAAKEAAEMARKKVPRGKPEPTFGPEGWLSHDGIFQGMVVRLTRGNHLLATSDR